MGRRRFRAWLRDRSGHGGADGRAGSRANSRLLTLPRERDRRLRAGPRRRISSRIYVFMPGAAGPGLLARIPTSPAICSCSTLLIAPVAIPVNLVVSIPTAARAVATGRMAAAVPRRTALIALGGSIPADCTRTALNRFGTTQFWPSSASLLGVTSCSSASLSRPRSSPRGPGIPAHPCDPSGPLGPRHRQRFLLGLNTSRPVLRRGAVRRTAGSRERAAPAATLRG